MELRMRRLAVLFTGVLASGCESEGGLAPNNDADVDAGADEDSGSTPNRWDPDPDCDGIQTACADTEAGAPHCIPGDCGDESPYCVAFCCLSLREAECECAAGTKDLACKRSPEKARSLEALLDCDEKTQDCSYDALGGPPLNVVMNKRTWEAASRTKDADGKTKFKPYVMVFDAKIVNEDFFQTVLDHVRMVVVDGKATEWTIRPGQGTDSVPVWGRPPDLSTVDEMLAELEKMAFLKARDDLYGSDDVIEHEMEPDPELGYPRHMAVRWSSDDDYKYEGNITCLSLDEIGPDACPLEPAPEDIRCVGASAAPEGCLDEGTAVCAPAENRHELCEGKCGEGLCEGSYAATCAAGLTKAAMVCGAGSVCAVDGIAAACTPLCGSREDPACRGYLCDAASGTCETHCETECAPGTLCIEGQCKARGAVCLADSECFPNACDEATYTCKTTLCDDDGDCDEGGGASCVHGECKRQCTDDTECSGYLCSSPDVGYCADDCSTSCGAGFLCTSNHVCVPSVAQCVDDAPCLPYACGGDGVCKRECSADADCASDLMCSFGRCIKTSACDPFHTEACAGFACDTTRGRCKAQCVTSDECAPSSAYGCLPDGYCTP